MHKKECIPSTFIFSSACLSNDSLQMIMGTTFLTMIEQRSIIANLRHTLTLVLTFWAPFHASNPLIFICRLETCVVYPLCMYLFRMKVTLFREFFGRQLNFYTKICWRRKLQRWWVGISSLAYKMFGWVHLGIEFHYTSLHFICVYYRFRILWLVPF